MAKHALLRRRTVLAAAAHAAGAVWAAPRLAGANGTDQRFEPEYARGLEEVLIVYDQVAPEYLFTEVAEIIGGLPPAATVHFLCSRGKEAAARARLEGRRMRAHLLVCDCEQLWGDWGRDIFHVGWRDGKTVLLVPYTKTSLTRGELTRGYEVMRTLLGPERDVRLVPLSFEGGNIAYDRIAGARVLFAGNSVIRDSIDMYRHWFDRALAVGECIELLRKSFNVDRVVLLGRERDGVPLRQASFFFHIDLACAIVAEGAVAIESFDLPPSLAEVRDEVRRDVELSVRDAHERARAEELLVRKGVRTKLPEKEADIAATIEAAFRAEVDRLKEAADELEAIEKTFRNLGYRIHRLRTDWRHVRRTQSYANVLAARDRLIMPIFPAPEAGKARVVMLPAGRQIVEVLRNPEPEAYAMNDFNLENYKLYQSIFGNVRVIRDSFYLAGGNVHCVVGAIG
jgi:hypothetical protein